MAWPGGGGGLKETGQLLGALLALCRKPLYPSGRLRQRVLSSMPCVRLHTDTPSPCLPTAGSGVPTTCPRTRARARSIHLWTAPRSRECGHVPSARARTRTTQAANGGSIQTCSAHSPQLASLRRCVPAQVHAQLRGPRQQHVHLRQSFWGVCGGVRIESRYTVAHVPRPVGSGGSGVG